MGDYDSFPLFSAFLMAFHKYGIFGLFCVWSWTITSLKVKESKSGPRLPEQRLESKEYRYWCLRGVC